MRIEEIDKNLQVASTLNIPDIRYYNALEEPFALYGLYRPRETGEFRRLPEKIAESVSPGVRDLSIHTSGGRVRFKTDSPYVAIKAALFNGGQMPHMPISGSHGFDLYVYNGVEDIYHNSFFPTCFEPDNFESVTYFSDKSMREITIHFPLYSGVKELLIGVAKDAELASDHVRRRDVIYQIFLTAYEGGDKNVYFIDGFSLFTGSRRYDCTVDGVHPTDLGFSKMAEMIGDKVRQCLACSPHPFI